MVGRCAGAAPVPAAALVLGTAVTGAGAAGAMGFFFGEAMAAAIPGADVPECTGLWLARAPFASPPRS